MKKPMTMGDFQQDAAGFVAALANHSNPVAVLNALERAIASTRLHVFGAWRVARHPNDMSGYIRSETVFFHHSVPRSLSQEIWTRTRMEGVASVMARMAWKNAGAFTFRECQRLIKSDSVEQWIFDVHESHGMPDGLMVPAVLFTPNPGYGNHWIVKFWSPRSITPDLSMEMRLEFEHLARHTAHRLSQLIKRPRRRDYDGLSRQQDAIMHCLWLGMEVEDVAQKLQVTESTVHTQWRRAQHKLGANTRAHALVRYGQLFATLMIGG